MPKVSIIVPVYNVEKYLKRCIDSILNQTFSDFELILVDDGSPDNSGAICDEYAKKDNRIRVIHKENGGVSSARNIGISEANGEYIMFVDSDDWLENAALEELIGDYDFSIGGCKAITLRHVFCYTLEEACLSPKEFMDVFVHETEKGNIIFSTPWSKVYRTSIIKDNGIKFDTNLKLTEDTKFNYEYFKYVRNVYCSSKIIYNYYRKNESCASGKYYEDYFFYKKTTYAKLAEWLSDSRYEGYLKRNTAEILASTLQHHFMHCSCAEIHEKIDKIYNENTEILTNVFKLVDEKWGGGYLKYLETQKWKALARRWKKKNFKTIVRNKVKAILLSNV